MAVGDDQICEIVVSGPKVRVKGATVSGARYGMRSRTTDAKVFKRFVKNAVKDLENALAEGKAKNFKIKTSGSEIKVEYTGNASVEFDKISIVCANVAASPKIEHA